MIRVLVVDDHAWVRESLSSLLTAADGVVVVGECADGSEVPAAVAAASPDVVVMDVQMPTVSGWEATRRLKASGAPARVVITGTAGAERTAQLAATAGADAVAPKGSSPELLVRTIRAVAAGTT